MNHALRDTIGDCRWEELTIGCSGATTHRLVGLSGQPTRYLKMMSRLAGSDLAFEAERTKWVSKFLPAPQVLDVREEGVVEYLLMSEVPGLHAAEPHWKGQAAQIVPLLAQGLKRVHEELSVEHCPFDMRTGLLMQMAKINVNSGLAEVEHAADVLADLQACKPETTEEDIVVLHGDYSFPNVLLSPEGDAVTGYVDWGRLGVGDRYLDLAIAIKSVILNVGEAWVPVFLQAYSPVPLSKEKLEWYRRLDALL